MLLTEFNLNRGLLRGTFFLDGKIGSVTDPFIRIRLFIIKDPDLKKDNSKLEEEKTFFLYFSVKHNLFNK